MGRKFKRHYKLLVLLLLVVAVLALGVGNQPIVAYSVGDYAWVLNLGAGAQAGPVLLDGTLAGAIDSQVLETSYK